MTLVKVRMVFVPARRLPNDPPEFVILKILVAPLKVTFPALIAVWMAMVELERTSPPTVIVELPPKPLERIELLDSEIVPVPAAFAVFSRSSVEPEETLTAPL